MSHARRGNARRVAVRGAHERRPRAVWHHVCDAHHVFGGGGSASVVTLYQVSPQTSDATPVVKPASMANSRFALAAAKLDRGARAMRARMSLQLRRRADTGREQHGGLAASSSRRKAATYPGVLAPFRLDADPDRAAAPISSGRATRRALSGACSSMRLAPAGMRPDQPLPRVRGLPRTMTLPRRPAAVVFDLDGTLIDSNCWCATHQHATRTMERGGDGCAISIARRLAARNE